MLDMTDLSLTPNGSGTQHLDNARFWFIRTVDLPELTVRGVSKEC